MKSVSGEGNPANNIPPPIQNIRKTTPLPPQPPPAAPPAEPPAAPPAEPPADPHSSSRRPGSPKTIIDTGKTTARIMTKEEIESLQEDTRIMTKEEIESLQKNIENILEKAYNANNESKNPIISTNLYKFKKSIRLRIEPTEDLKKVWENIETMLQETKSLQETESLDVAKYPDFTKKVMSVLKQGVIKHYEEINKAETAINELIKTLNSAKDMPTKIKYPKPKFLFGMEGKYDMNLTTRNDEERYSIKELLIILKTSLSF